MRHVLAFLALFAGAVQAAGDGLKAGAFDPPRLAPELALDGSDGARLELGRHRGKVVALGFGFSHCPEICPTTLATLAKARRKLGPQGRELQVIYVTVDPERDSPERLRTYLTGFDPTFIGGAGTPEQLARVRNDYGILAARKQGKGGDYGVDHSSFVYLIDRAGRLRALVPYGRSADDIAHDVSILLRK